MLLFSWLFSWRSRNLGGRFHYARSGATLGATALSYADGTPRRDIAQGRIGTKIAPGTPKELNIVVETKDVENKTELRGEEEIKISCAKIFFETLDADGYTVVFRDQLHNKQMRQIISEVLAQEDTIHALSMY